MRSSISCTAAGFGSFSCRASESVVVAVTSDSLSDSSSSGPGDCVCVGRATTVFLLFLVCRSWAFSLAFFSAVLRLCSSSRSIPAILLLRLTDWASVALDSAVVAISEYWRGPVRQRYFYVLSRSWQFV